MKKTLTGMILSLLLLGVFLFSYIQSDGMRLLPFEMHASAGFDKVFAILLWLFFVWMSIRSVILLSRKKQLNKILLIFIAVVLAALSIYMAFVTITLFFCNSCPI